MSHSFVHSTNVTKYCLWIACYTGFWFQVKWSRHIPPHPFCSLYLQTLDGDGLHGAAMWGMRKVNNIRQTGERDQNLKCHQISSELHVFPLLESLRSPCSPKCRNGHQHEQTKLQEEPCISYSERRQKSPISLILSSLFSSSRPQTNLCW